MEAAELRLVILAVQREGSRRLAAALRPLGLTALQGEILARLAQSAPVTLSELGERLICSVDLPSRAVEQLVKRGAVRRRRVRGDRRKSVLQLTPAGRALANRALEAFGRVDGVIVDNLDESMRLDALSALRQLPFVGDAAAATPYGLSDRR